MITGPSLNVEDMSEEAVIKNRINQCAKEIIGLMGQRVDEIPTETKLHEADKWLIIARIVNVLFVSFFGSAFYTAKESEDHR